MACRLCLHHCSCHTRVRIVMENLGGSCKTSIHRGFIFKFYEQHELSAPSRNAVVLIGVQCNWAESFVNRPPTVRCLVLLVLSHDKYCYMWFSMSRISAWLLLCFLRSFQTTPLTCAWWFWTRITLFQYGVCTLLLRNRRRELGCEPSLLSAATLEN